MSPAAGPLNPLRKWVGAMRPLGDVGPRQEVVNVGRLDSPDRRRFPRPAFVSVVPMRANVVALVSGPEAASTRRGTEAAMPRAVRAPDEDVLTPNPGPRTRGGRHASHRLEARSFLRISAASVEVNSGRSWRQRLQVHPAISRQSGGQEGYGRPHERHRSSLIRRPPIAKPGRLRSRTAAPPARVTRNPARARRRSLRPGPVPCAR